MISITRDITEENQPPELGNHTMSWTAGGDMLPIFTTLIGVGGFTVGIYSFINPVAAARIYGVPVRTSKLTLTSVLASSSTTEHSKSDHIPTATTPDLSFIHALGIRNLAAGLTILVLNWYFMLLSVTTFDPVKNAIQRALGIVILTGSCVPMVDAWVCWRHSQKAYLALRTKIGSDRQESDRKGVQDVETSKQDRSISNNDKWQKEAYETGRKAGNLHAARSLVWIFGGLWCLFG